MHKCKTLHVPFEAYKDHVDADWLDPDKNRITSYTCHEEGGSTVRLKSISAVTAETKTREYWNG